MKKTIIAMALAMAPLAYAQGQGVCDPDPESRLNAPVVERLRKLIQGKQFAALEDELGDRLRRYETGQYSDLALWQLLDETMSSNDVSFSPILDQWAAENPRQFMAHLAKAIHHIKIAHAKRGNKFADKTSVEQMDAMMDEFAKSMSSLKAALEIQPNSSLARAAVIMISRATSGRKVSLQWLVEAEKVDPRNQAARWAAISALDPRWGGVPEDLDQLLERAAKSPLPAPRLRALQWKVEMTRAEYFHTATKERTKAMAHYRKAAGLCQSSQAQWQISSLAYDLEDWPVVVDATTRYLELRPDAYRAYARRGWAKERLARLPEAIADYEKASDLGDAWAQNKLGYLLMTGNGVPKDIPRARRLFNASAEQGNNNAQKNLDLLR